MQNTAPAAGDPVEARCTKCRRNTGHRILTMAGEGPGKVQCTTCSHQHQFRLPAKPRKPAVRRSANLKAAEGEEWETLRQGMHSAAAREYSITAAYDVKALINHPVFGLGVVQRIAGRQKVEVLFADGRKIMRCK